MVERLVIEGLAADVARLEEKARAYSELFRAAMDVFVEQGLEIRRLERRYEELRDELRRYVRQQVES